MCKYRFIIMKSAEFYHLQEKTSGKLAPTQSKHSSTHLDLESKNITMRNRQAVASTTRANIALQTGYSCSSAAHRYHASLSYYILLP